MDRTLIGLFAVLCLACGLYNIPRLKTAQAAPVVDTQSYYDDGYKAGLAAGLEQLPAAGECACIDCKCDTPEATPVASPPPTSLEPKATSPASSCADGSCGVGGFRPFGGFFRRGR